MITCESCRTENADAAQFCDECGKPLAPSGARAAGPGTGGPDFRSQPPAEARPAASWQAPALGEGGNGGSRAPLVFPEPSQARAAAAGAGAAAPSTPAAAEPARPQLAAHAVLTINRGRSAGKDFPVHEDEAYIGRWDADSGIFPDVDLDADDPEAKVSRRHARVTRRGGQYFIEDLGSTNGTFVNRGRRLLPGDRQPLNDGDEIIIGKTFLRFRVVK
jgi:hypothetical protein